MTLQHTPDTGYQKVLAGFAPEMNALHMETLAYSVGSTLNGMPTEFFAEIAQMSRQWGADRLRQWHEAETCN